MTLVLSELYDALRAAGASEDKARQAAAAVVRWVPRLVTIERDVRVVKWMAGTTLVLTGAVLLTVCMR